MKIPKITNPGAKPADSIDLELPYPPSVNNYWQSVVKKGTRRVMVFISKEGREFRELVCAILLARPAACLEGPLDVEVVIHPPNRMRRDVDNIAKALLDALQHGGAYRDDSQIVRLSIEKRWPVAGGKTLVTIRKLAVAEEQLALFGAPEPRNGFDE